MNRPDIQLTEVLPDDLPALQEISRRTFFDSFAEMNSAENMQQFLDNHFSANKLSGEIRNPGSTFYFAKVRGEIAGYLKLNRDSAQSVLPNEGGVEIERIYVCHDFKNLGIGKIFIQQAVEFAKAVKASYLWLGVWEHNNAAISFYEKNGFVRYDTHIFQVGDDPQTDLLMKKPL